MESNAIMETIEEAIEEHRPGRHRGDQEALCVSTLMGADPQTHTEGRRGNEDAGLTDSTQRTRSGGVWALEAVWWQPCTRIHRRRACRGQHAALFNMIYVLRHRRRGTGPQAAGGAGVCAKGSRRCSLLEHPGDAEVQHSVGSW